MNAALLTDFGSTCTKVTAVDLSAHRILGTAYDFTTVQTDVAHGLDRALQKLKEKTGEIDYQVHLACSSAAGGLRMLSCGLVPSLTAKAAHLAALGAGAKVLKTYAYQLTEEDGEEITRLSPDIFLLTGGTDGGNTEAIVHNARVLASLPGKFPIVIAGNRAAASKCREIIETSDHPALVTENVMPSFNVLNILPAQQLIRDIFLERIIKAKGLTKAAGIMDDIVMPTPSAVMTALQLLSDGVDGKMGLGELMAVDLGGATTDIYSIASGAPGSAATLLSGLPEPYAKRTVEGDIGMRYSARGVVEAAGIQEVARVAGLSADEVERQLLRIDEDKSLLPDCPEMEKLDFALASLAIRTGLLRHAGTVHQVYTPVGPVFQQKGKDLTRVQRLLLTGGALIHSPRMHDMLKAALTIAAPEALIPWHAAPVADAEYILSAMGLLSQKYPEVAFDIMYQTFGKDVH
ncbi:MAG: glutamate mutase L [Clostridia bacterium]|nr:glutamate mutase L [Clostridia bacterium]